MNIRILIVDDEEDNRKMLSRHFRFNGYEVETAEHGEEALEILEEKKIDIVISDIMMPVLDGIGLLKELHSTYPTVHTIMITGYVTLENALSCMRYGAETCIFKPLKDLTSLDEAVDKAVKSIHHWLKILEELRAMKPAEGAAAL